MRRRYQRELYAERIHWIKEIMPDCCIGVDVIVGFPGETEEDFLETFHFIHSLDVSYLHVFTYSERANTMAAEMSEAVPMDVRRERNERLRILSQKKLRAFYQKYENTCHDVLFENHSNEDLMSGFTDNYVKVILPKEESLVNTIQSVRLLKYNDEAEAFEGQLISEEIFVE